MKLYLVQHGEALSKDEDPGRPLSPRGEDEVRRIAGFLQQAGVETERILHSGKMRAQQTADLLAEALLSRQGEIEAVDGIAPDDPVEVFAIKLRELNADSMVVGHLPFMARLVTYLAGSDAGTPLVAYRPGSVVCLDQDDGGRWLIQWMLRPDLLNGR